MLVFWDASGIILIHYRQKRKTNQKRLLYSVIGPFAGQNQLEGRKEGKKESKKRIEKENTTFRL